MAELQELEIIPEELTETRQNERKWEEKRFIDEEEEEDEEDEEEEEEENETAIGDDEDEELEKEDEDNEDDTEADGDSDDFAGYKPKYKGARQKETEVREKSNEEELRKLLGVDWKKGQRASIATIITMEEETWGEDSGSTSTTTFPCLKDIDISDSRLKLLNLFNFYPIPEDPGVVPAFWILYPPPPTYREDGIQKFSDIMKVLGLRPIRCVAEMLHSDKLNLRYYGVDPKAVRAICEAIKNNMSVQKVDLKDNWLTMDACFHINDMLSENGILASLSLSGCHVGAQGVKRLVEGLATSRSLVSLDLSHCALEDEGVNFLAPAIQINQVLRNLNLADNHLGTDSTRALQMMLTKNDSLHRLNLSWNGLFAKDASKCLFKGLFRNKSLIYVNLAWNALGKECLPPLGTFIARNRIVLQLNLSGNRFTEDGGVAIAKSLAKNVGLKELFIGNNPLKAQGALALVEAVTPECSPNSRMQYLDLENVWAKREILPELEKIENGRPWLTVKLGGILGSYRLVGPDPRKIFLKRANYEAMMPKRKKQRKAFGHFVLTLGDNLITKGKFKELIGKFKLKLSDSLVKEIMDAFLGPQKKVDQAALKAFYLEQYRETIPPLPVPKKKRKGKGGSNDAYKDRGKSNGKKLGRELKETKTAKGMELMENGKKKKILKVKTTAFSIQGEEYESEEGESWYTDRE